jgi:hypothetical protein
MLHGYYRTWADEAGHQILAKNSFGRALRGLLPQLKTTGAGAKRDHVGVALSETGQSQFDALMDEKNERRKVYTIYRLVGIACCTNTTSR